MHTHHKMAIAGALLTIALGPRLAASVLRALLIVALLLATIFFIVEPRQWYRKKPLPCKQEESSKNYLGKALVFL
jgi:uncharacterized membrane protein YfcA